LPSHHVPIVYNNIHTRAPAYRIDKGTLSSTPTQARNTGKTNAVN
jgi:hypothetical protein